MLKKFLLASLMVAAVSMAQTAAAKNPLSVGMKTGFAFGTLSSYGELEFAVARKTGFGGGLYLGMGNDKVQFQPEVLFVASGAKIEGMNLSVSALELPLLAKFYLSGASSPNRLHVLIGPAMDLILSAKMKDEEDDETEDVKDMLESVIVSVVTGVGVENGKVSVNLSLRTGLNNVFKEDFAEGMTVRSNGVYLMVGYKIK